MKIIIIPSTDDCQNMGDVAMLQTAVESLSMMWPDSRIRVLTQNPALLAEYCPRATPLFHGMWFSEKYLLGRVHRLLPKRISRELIQCRRSLRCRWPKFDDWAVRRKTKTNSADALRYNEFQAAFENADLVLASGAGGIGDQFPRFSFTVLDLLERAHCRGKLTALFSQGFCRTDRADLLITAARVLPRMQLIALRESLVGIPLLRRIGVSSERILVTGDDAVRPAYEARSSVLGMNIGINIRVATYTEVNARQIDLLRPVLHDLANNCIAALIPLPIARHQVNDAHSTSQLLRAKDHVRNEGVDLNTPGKIIDAIGSCRIVITGAYHAAVFALAQGIPTICLAASEYFINKFEGLKAQFGSGCQVIRIDDDASIARVNDVGLQLWKNAAELRRPLLEAARRQIELSQSAYQQLRNAWIEMEGGGMRSELADRSSHSPTHHPAGRNARVANDRIIH